jgi:hypothetical protein
MGRGTVGWSPELAYAVGLIATDGNLGRRTATISMVSKDIDLLETMRRCLDVETQIRPHRGGYSKRCHRLAWRDRWRRIDPRVHGSLPCKEERTLHLRSSLRVDRLCESTIRSPIRPVGRPRIGWILAAWFPSGFATRMLVAGGVLELADNGASKALARKGVGVQIPSPPPLPSLTQASRDLYREASRGAVAQLGEHKAGSLGVRGSNPLSSTILQASDGRRRCQIF